MIVVYSIDDQNSVIQHRIAKEEDLIMDGVVWVDIFCPTADEENWIKKFYNVDIPSSEEVDKSEVTSPFYKEKSLYYMTTTVVDRSDAHYLNNSPITFILAGKRLFTVRYENKDLLRQFIMRIMSQEINIAIHSNFILTTMIDVFININGSILEKTGDKLDYLLKSVFNKERSNLQSSYYNEIIEDIGLQGNIISKNRESLVSINRMLIYCKQITKIESFNTNESEVRMKNLIQELHSINEYANFLSQRNSFLLDATLGMISVEQNMIIKFFTVASAIFMPPTLISSIYGMNFKNMPELSSSWGYGTALFAIITSSILPYLFFKKKGWL